jgi:hypothetical protein
MAQFTITGLTAALGNANLQIGQAFPIRSAVVLWPACVRLTFAGFW